MMEEDKEEFQQEEEEEQIQLQLEEFVQYKFGDVLYDLYAVSNHMGGMSGGHYTAYGKNFKNGKWYHFDDALVEEVKEKDVVTGKAYVLFYKRRNAPVLNIYQYE